MIGIVYSSKTGNTQSLANSLNFMESKYCVPVENAKNLEPVDLLCIGFWCDKGDCDDQMKQYLSTLRNQNVFLFGTAGFGKSKEYFEMILKNPKECFCLQQRHGCVKVKCLWQFVQSLNRILKC